MISDVSRIWAYLMGVDRSLRKYFSTVIISHVFRKQNSESCRCWTIILYFVTIYQYNKVRWHQCIPWNLWYLGALNTKLILHIMSNLNLELTWIYSTFSILYGFDNNFFIYAILMSLPTAQVHNHGLNQCDPSNQWHWIQQNKHLIYNDLNHVVMKLKW